MYVVKRPLKGRILLYMSTRIEKYKNNFTPTNEIMVWVWAHPQRDC